MKKAIVIISVCVICVIIMLNGVSFISSPEQKIAWEVQTNWRGVTNTLLQISQYALEYGLTTDVIDSEPYHDYFGKIKQKLEVKQLYVEPNGVVFLVLEYRGSFMNGIEYGIYYSPEKEPLISNDYLSFVATENYFDNYDFEIYNDYYILGKRNNGTDFYLTKMISMNVFYFEYHLSH